jgi:Ser/Thr protein kinase RdoA (MazF antagonist)
MFTTLSYNAQVMHLSTFARDALATWNITPDDLTLVIYENNAVYRVTHGDNTYALRVYRPGHKPAVVIQAEWAWLRLLSESGVRVPQPVASLYAGDLAGVDAPVHAALFRWIHGNVIPLANLAPTHTERTGRMMAHLHVISAGATFTPDDVLSQRPRLGYEGLFGERSPYNPGIGIQYISTESERVLAAVGERVREVMTTLDAHPQTFGFIHGDLIYKNTLFTPSGEPAAIDFDDSGFGYYLYDMACPMLFYRGLPQQDALKNALWDGYNAVRPLPFDFRPMLETLIAGRYVASCRWVASNAEHPAIRGQATAIIEDRVNDLRVFLKTGML